ncbi:MAG TPA: C39 family peptidase [Deltaproteobacteria bacterium]|nr:C39 family peptidase [Deltaproteobacteria bacterium]
MEIIISFVIMIAFLGTVYPMRDLPKGNIQLFPGMTGMENLAVNETVRPLSELKDKNIVKQKYDFSCGSAALATLLNYYLGEKFDEQQVIQGLMQYGEAAKIEKRRAFSLLDMKRFVEVLGYKAAGYKAEIEDLKALGKPAIVPIEFSGYRHFVVLRGIIGENVFVADPYMGNTSYSEKHFLAMWNQKIVFVVSSDTITMSALELRNEDLRIIDYDIEKSAAIDLIPTDTVTRQQEVIESLGTRVYKKL